MNMTFKEQAMTDQTRRFIWDKTRVQNAGDRCVTAYENGELFAVLAYKPDGELTYVCQTDETSLSKAEKKARIDHRILNILDGVFGTGLPLIKAFVKRGNTRALRVFSYFFSPPERSEAGWSFTMTAEQWAEVRHEYGGQ